MQPNSITKCLLIFTLLLLFVLGHIMWSIHNIPYQTASKTNNNALSFTDNNLFAYNEKNIDVQEYLKNSTMPAIASVYNNNDQHKLQNIQEVGEQVDTATLSTKESKRSRRSVTTSISKYRSIIRDPNMSDAEVIRLLNNEFDKYLNMTSLR